MRAEVEKMKKYYIKGKISKSAIDTLLAKGKITQEEYDYIIASDEV